MPHASAPLPSNRSEPFSPDGRAWLEATSEYAKLLERTGDKDWVRPLAEHGFNAT